MAVMLEALSFRSPTMTGRALTYSGFHLPHRVGSPSQSTRYMLLSRTCCIGESISTTALFRQSSSSSTSAIAPYTNMSPMASPLLVVDVPSHSASAALRKGSSSFLVPRLSTEREGKPFTLLMGKRRSIASMDSRMFCNASSDFVTAYRNTSAPSYMDVHRPSLSESSSEPVDRFP